MERVEVDSMITSFGKPPQKSNYRNYQHDINAIWQKHYEEYGIIAENQYQWRQNEKVE
ncbi:hypothetical protein [Candidatus Methanoperedens nitratireducens]|uniref:hypothetical protein n=1 Tax=Candidatus Methanoperedens nitratireducens TaxID=1392998 RepID=UPI0015CAA45B|nr:hypothetical protein [Candidatus Methanoperedens nitroreducens]MBZ0175345.1 hypothetical protein [Candidatus Methanoperedens nitroreducens]MCX9079488.1 hypothetical protein [Candidatus Methanoperedens sp.]